MGLHCIAWAFLTASCGLSCSATCGILVSQPGTEPASPALEGGFLTTGQVPQDDLSYTCERLFNKNKFKPQKKIFSDSWWSILSCVQLFATLWTVACQAPLSMGFFRQEYRSGFSFPFPRDLSKPGIESESPAQAESLMLSHQRSLRLSVKNI